MKNNIKPHRYYYLCQCIGILLFALFLLLFKEHDGNFWTLSKISERALSIFAISAISHFIIRKTIKRKSNHSDFNLKMYISVILIASFTLYLLQTSIDMIINLKINAEEQKREFAKSMAVGVVIYTCWCILYIAITSVRDKIQLSHQLKEQQLTSLMNQINPHFLFNSLNTIRGMMYEDRDKAADLITQFANLFRYNLSLDKRTTTTLGAELQICEQYLAIESIRLGDRLQLDIDIPSDCHHCKIPVMGLLTLVENSVKHGIAPLKQGGTLIIISRIANNRLIVEVINPYDSCLTKSGTEIGLQNLDKRIGLLFANQGKLIQTAQNDIFHVTLQLPSEFNYND